MAFLDVAHRAIAGSLIIVTLGGFTFFGERFLSLVAHIKKHVAENPPAAAPAAAQQGSAAPAPPKLA
jgi:hypothetical protein